MMTFISTMSEDMYTYQVSVQSNGPTSENQRGGGGRVTQIMKIYGKGKRYFPATLLDTFNVSVLVAVDRIFLEIWHRAKTK